MGNGADLRFKLPNIRRRPGTERNSDIWHATANFRALYRRYFRHMGSGGAGRLGKRGDLPRRLHFRCGPGLMAVGTLTFARRIGFPREETAPRIKGIRPKPPILWAHGYKVKVSKNLREPTPLSILIS